MKKLLTVLFILVACIGTSSAQTGVTPMTLNVGPIGGLVLPLGDYSNAVSAGYNVGAEAKFGALLPFTLNTSFTYSALSGKTPDGAPAGYTTYNSTQLSLTAGPEFSFPSPGMTPYVGADIMYNMLGSNAPNSTSVSRFGLGFGGGVQFGQIDGSVKYQLLNLVGKDTGENSYSQIAFRVAYLFPAL